MNGPSPPPDVIELKNALHAVDHDVVGLVERLSEKGLNWQSRPGQSWSIAQCLDHLAVTNSLYVEAMAKGAAEARAAGELRKGPIRPGFLERFMISSLEPPPKLKLPAPKRIVPASTATKDEVVGKFLDAQEAARKLLVSCADLNLNRATFPSPFAAFLKLSVGCGFLIIAAHDRRHVFQGRNVRKTPGFPG